MSTASSNPRHISDNDLEDYDFSSFEENPSWLVADIAAMMEAKKTRYKGAAVLGDKDPASKMAKEIRTMKANLKPDKNEIYKNFGKEKAVTSSADLNELRMRKTKLDMESHIDEAKVREFMGIIQQQNKDKVAKHGEFMKRALYQPNPATLPGLPRRWSPTRPRPQTEKIEATSPFASTSIRPLSPPVLQRPPSPTINFHDLILQEMRDKRQVDVTSKIAIDVQSALLVFVKAAKYYKLIFERSRDVKLLKLRFYRASRKIQHSFKRMQTQNSLERYLRVPPVFTQFLYRWKRRKALDVVVSFIKDVQNCKTKRIVRRFLLAVKKVQTYIRQYLEVREARILMISIYWEREERIVRRQLEETERANYARNEKLRLKRMGKSVHSSSIFEKWNLTHNQVEALYEHINDVDVTRANVIRLNEGPAGGGRRAGAGGKGVSSEEDQSNLFMEMCDPDMVRAAILRHIRVKRHLHLQNQLAEEDSDSREHMLRLQEMEMQKRASGNLLMDQKAVMREHAYNNYINLKVVRKYVQDFSAKNNKDLLSRQLAIAGIDVDEEERASHARNLVAQASSKYKVQQSSMKLENFGRNKEESREGRMFKLKTFFLMTGGPELGKSWKSYIEENVKAETLRKKKILQEKNEASIQESMRTQQERAMQQRQLAYQAKHNSRNAYGGPLEALSVSSQEGDEEGLGHIMGGTRRRSLGRPGSGGARHAQSAPSLSQPGQGGSRRMGGGPGGKGRGRGSRPGSSEKERPSTSYLTQMDTDTKKDTDKDRSDPADVAAAAAASSTAPASSALPTSQSGGLIGIHRKDRKSYE